MTLAELAAVLREARLARDRARDGARLALLAIARDPHRYWRLEQEVDRLEARLLELLEEYFQVSDRVRAAAGGDEALAFEAAARRWLAREPGTWITIHRGGDTVVLRADGRAA